MFAGAVVFFLGDKFLYEVKHVKFLYSEAFGILGGVLLMLLGAGITRASKSSRQNQHDG
jgi:hypothetical protein